MNNKWLRSHPKGTLILLHIQPGSSYSGIAGIHGDRLKVKIKAPPRDGQANEALVSFFSELFGIPKARIFLLRGESSRQKDLLIELPLDKIIFVLEGLK